MDNYGVYPTTAYQSPYQNNWYYQPTQTVPMYNRNWQQQTTVNAPSYAQSQVTQQANNGMIWVQGESGAKAYVLPNGATLPLWDSESQTIYIKSVDVNGKPSMTILDYTERTSQETEKEQPKIEYATKDQVNGLTQQFSSINEKLSSFGSYVTKDQFESLNNQLNDLSSQIEDIENRITSFGKPQQNTQNNRRGNK